MSMKMYMFFSMLCSIWFCVGFVSGLYKFTTAGQILRSSNNVQISDSFSFSVWIRRTKENLNQFVLNIGTSFTSNSMLTVGYRNDNAFIFSFNTANNDLVTPVQTDLYVWVNW
jgi:hypothetical protein